MNKLKQKINNQINNLKQDLLNLSNDIEIERLECTSEDNATKQDLLDKKLILESQIADLINSLAMIENNTESFGQKYTLDMNGKKRQITIVHKTEADPSLGKISSESPLAQALKNNKEGNNITVTTPTGIINYKICN